VTFDADAMPALVVVDVLSGSITYTRDGVTDTAHDGETVLASGWQMPFTGSGGCYDIRTTSLTGELVAAAIAEIDPERSGPEVRFRSYVPHSKAAAARWRAIVDELASSFPDVSAVLGHIDATLLLGHTLLDTFPNDVMDSDTAIGEPRELAGGGPSAVRRALHVIEDHAGEELTLEQLAAAVAVTPRGLQYAFRKELGCTPQDYVRRVRLDLARQALRDGSSESVGDAAARFGFFNPGRFASDYRQVFDENPGQTLMRDPS
jgi:AraC-like DNA-binding protein